MANLPLSVAAGKAIAVFSLAQKALIEGLAGGNICDNADGSGDYVVREVCSILYLAESALRSSLAMERAEIVFADEIPASDVADLIARFEPDASPNGVQESP